MALRVAIGGISHETNTFCTPTELEEFRCLAGEEILKANRGVRSYIGGMLAAAERLGMEAVPVVEAEATPSGTIREAALQSMIQSLVSGIRSAGAVDGVCLALHGAGVSEQSEDIETVVLTAVREAVGPSLPIMGTLDLHGNLTADMLAPATALFGVHLYPHVDAYERGIEAMECLHRVLEGRSRPAMALERLPLIVPTSTSSLDPVRTINEYCWQCEKRPGVLDVVFFHGFAHTDIREMGTSVLVVTEGDEALAKDVARDVAHFIWERRAEFDRAYPDGEGVLREARDVLRQRGGPVVINDTSDNPGGGAPGDGTHLLRAVLADNPERAVFGFIYDPESAAAAHAAGVGAEIDVRLGGKTYPLHGEPIATRAYVKCLTDGRFVHSTPMGQGARVDLGPMARLTIGNVDVLVSSVREQTLDAEVFGLHGIDVRRCDLVFVKSSNHFRAGFDPLASAILTADTKGMTSCNLHSFPYRRMRHPVAPLDDVDYR